MTRFATRRRSPASAALDRASLRGDRTGQCGLPAGHRLGGVGPDLAGAGVDRWPGDRTGHRRLCLLAAGALPALAADPGRTRTPPARRLQPARLPGRHRAVVHAGQGGRDAALGAVASPRRGRAPVAGRVLRRPAVRRRRGGRAGRKPRRYGFD